MTAPAYTELKSQKKWLEDHKIKTLEWPANSPDLNPIENIWGILTRAVFENGRQFKYVKDLKAEILKQWGLIRAKTIQNLIDSMTDRIIEVIKNNGGNTTY